MYDGVVVDGVYVLATQPSVAIGTCAMCMSLPNKRVDSILNSRNVRFVIRAIQI